MKISVVIPLCNEEKTLETLAGGIAEQLAPYDYEILFIDDGSTDGSLALLQKLRAGNEHIHLLSFRENQGKTLALAVAFSQVDADVVVTMDADLQDDPAELPRLLAKLADGYDLVCGWKEKRHDPIHKTFPSKIYNTTINTLFGLKIHDVNTGYKAMGGDVLQSLTLYADMHRLIPIMAAQAGYRVGEIAVTHHPRRFGHSHYGIARFYQGIRDACRLGFQPRATHQAKAKAALEAALQMTVDS